MVEQIIVSTKVKRSVIISNKLYIRVAEKLKTERILGNRKYRENPKIL